MRKIIIIACLLSALAGAGVVWRATHQPVAKPTEQTPTFNKQEHSLSDPTSLWVIVNKQRPLNPMNYVPEDLVFPEVPLRVPGGKDEMRLRKAAAEALKQLYEAAKRDNLQLMVASAYRSYEYQQGLYNHYVNKQGKQTADTQSARPGHSEHQTGLAVDIGSASRECEVESCFAEMPEGKWVAAHAHKYGFIIRYEEGEQPTTGYIYEPWHLRYVGAELSRELHRLGNPTLETFFDIGKAPNYP